MQLPPLSLVWKCNIFSGLGIFALVITALSESGLEGVGEYLRVGLAVGGGIGGILAALIGAKVLRMGNELTNTQGTTIRSKIEDIAGETKGVRDELREIDQRLFRVEERMRLSQEKRQNKETKND